MQVAILAGGLGTRLHPITLSLPKPMVLIHGRPFLEYQLEWVRHFGFDRVLLLIGYRAEAIEQHFEDGRRWNLEIRYSVEPTPMGTAGALKLAEVSLDDEFLLLNGDTYLPIDYRVMARSFDTGAAKGLMAVYANPDGIAPNNVEVSDTGMVVRYDKNLSPRLNGVDAGAYVMSKRALSAIPAGRASALEGELFPAMALAGELRAHRVAERYYDIGTFERLAVAEQSSWASSPPGAPLSLPSPPLGERRKVRGQFPNR
jgi:mannose-1-phosphate guanylyltransferase